jgi:peptidoglycan/xylan/chitin deacetylase (PgdA/CDA1 family)
MQFAIKRLARSIIGLGGRLGQSMRPRGSGAELAVFCFHDITDDPARFEMEHGLAVSSQVFRAQVQWICENFDIIHPNDIGNPASLPRRGALLTFDDGFHGSFENGIRWLSSCNLPCVMFLNMRTIVERRPMLSAIVCYLERTDERFRVFADSIGLRRPYYLTATPNALGEFEQRHGPIELDAALSYQGALADPATLETWRNDRNVTYGNHLLDHWNAAALTRPELEEQYERNERMLAKIGNPSGLFAFPNGQPGSCWTNRDVDVIKRLGAVRVFSASGRVNRSPGDFVLDRIAIGPSDDTWNRLWYRYLRARSRGPLPAV